MFVGERNRRRKRDFAVQCLHSAFLMRARLYLYGKLQRTVRVFGLSPTKPNCTVFIRTYLCLQVLNTGLFMMRHNS
ncbi:hypothetical protein L249_6201 [Ophiocordyceps polyrhachis-furcata BCC 54312]|uniref:Uncharacterized protein n=1 Tax=Ophiocordyceps polyrhachis-furcata BCC 54312 TaxID=1330021 RepID=A0A367LIT0_9HYPO|nr:hypothetical protein L249_6201 [Ophiocordyceps polyrhachis-furcata BCC 54312]